MNQEKINSAVARWTDPASRPLFKGSLIDENGCCCAQGDILRVECGMSDEALRSIGQSEADRKVAEELGISRFHAVLLRIVNDRSDGAPQSVLTDPKSVLGEHAERVLAFGRHLDSMTKEQWAAAGAAAWDAAGAAARAVNEIQGQDIMREKNQPFYFLPMFGFNSPEEIPVP